MNRRNLIARLGALPFPSLDKEILQIETLRTAKVLFPLLSVILQKVVLETSGDWYLGHFGD